MFVKVTFYLSISAVILSLSILMRSDELIINISSSLSPGFYIRATGSIEHGDIISFCLAKPSQTFGLQRGYLMSGQICHGSVPLLKEVIAVPGDDVALSMTSIIVNGKVYSAVTDLVDSQNRKLFIFPRGTYLHTSGYWLFGNNSVKSWDSRYWGPVQSFQIISKMKPLLTW